VTQTVPWGRIVTESLAIIASILIAFGIDAAWDARNERADRAEVSAALKLDFEENRAAVARALNYHVLHAEHLNTLAALTPVQVSELPSDFADSLAALGSLAPTATFDPIRGTVDALIGAGRLDLLRDHDLRNLVVTFLSSVDDMREEVDAMAWASERVWILEEAHGGPWRITAFGPPRAGTLDVAKPLDAATLARIRSDSTLMNATRTFQRQALLYRDVLRRLSIQIDSVLSLLEDAPSNDS